MNNISKLTTMLIAVILWFGAGQLRAQTLVAGDGSFKMTANTDALSKGVGGCGGTL
jgi:hypothetical protein